jgi:hypothetical protein
MYVTCWPFKPANNIDVKSQDSFPVKIESKNDFWIL